MRAGQECQQDIAADTFEPLLEDQREAGWNQLNSGSVDPPEGV